MTMMGDVLALRAKPPSLFNRSAHSAEPTPKIRASVHLLLCGFVLQLVVSDAGSDRVYLSWQQSQSQHTASVLARSRA